MDRDAALTIIRAAVAESLGLTEAEVAAESRLVTDLGANSLDIIDLMFTLEKRFGVRLKDGELEALFKIDVTAPEVVQDGYLTPATIARLAPFLPALGAAPDPARVEPRDLIPMITVETLWLAVARRLEGGG